MMVILRLTVLLLSVWGAFAGASNSLVAVALDMNRLSQFLFIMAIFCAWLGFVGGSYALVNLRLATFILLAAAAGILLSYLAGSLAIDQPLESLPESAAEWTALRRASRAFLGALLPVGLLLAAAGVALVATRRARAV